MKSHKMDTASELLQKSANLIEALEAENEALRSEKNARSEALSVQKSASISARYEQVTGATLDADVRDKIAKDADVAGAFERIIAGNSPTSLGGAVRHGQYKKAAAKLTPEEEFAIEIMR